MKNTVVRINSIQLLGENKKNNECEDTEMEATYEGEKEKIKLNGALLTCRTISRCLMNQQVNPEESRKKIDEIIPQSFQSIRKL